jgi:hypothetical protein
MPLYPATRHRDRTSRYRQQFETEGNEVHHDHPGRWPRVSGCTAFTGGSRARQVRRQLRLRRTPAGRPATTYPSSAPPPLRAMTRCATRCGGGRFGRPRGRRGTRVSPLPVPDWRLSPQVSKTRPKPSTTSRRTPISSRERLGSRRRASAVTATAPGKWVPCGARRRPGPAGGRARYADPAGEGCPAPVTGNDLE